MRHLFHTQDLHYLRTFGANPDHKSLQADYDKYRDCYVKADRKGELPQAILLDLAKKYPITNGKPKGDKSK